jgi:N-acetylglucosaminyldiphosphoundecaprenol N-acetyl-beta-D-mannosaminyltransferase
MREKILFDVNTFSEIKEDILNHRIKEKTVFSFMNSHCIYEFKTNKDYRNATTSHNIKHRINSIDGSLLAVVLSIKNFKRAKRLQGPKLMKLFLMDKELNNCKKHFFIGYENKDLDKLCKSYPHLDRKNIFGYLPSFVEGNVFPKDEVKKMEKLINENKIDYLWNGMGCPKQQILSEQLINRANAKYFFNVGAALNFNIGKISRAPIIFQKFGIEWLHRLYTDPKLTSMRLYPSFMGGLYAFVFARLKKRE